MEALIWITGIVLFAILVLLILAWAYSEQSNLKLKTMSREGNPEPEGPNLPPKPKTPITPKQNEKTPKKPKR